MGRRQATAAPCQLHAIVSWRSRTDTSGGRPRRPGGWGGAGGSGGPGLGGGGGGYRRRGLGTQTRRTRPARPELSRGAAAVWARPRATELWAGRPAARGWTGRISRPSGHGKGPVRPARRRETRRDDRCVGSARAVPAAPYITRLELAARQLTTPHKLQAEARSRKRA